MTTNRTTNRTTDGTTRLGAVRARWAGAALATATASVVLLSGCSGAEVDDPDASPKPEVPTVTAEPAAEGDDFVMPDSLVGEEPEVDVPGLDAAQVEAVRQAWETRRDQFDEFRIHRDKLDGRTCTALEGAWIEAQGQGDVPQYLVIGVPPADAEGREAASGMDCTTDEVLAVEAETGRVVAGVDVARTIFGAEPAGAS